MNDNEDSFDCLVRNQVFDKVREPFWPVEMVGVQVNDLVLEQVWDQVREKVRHQVEDRVWWWVFKKEINQ
jgi:hypothetical protein